MMGKGRRWILAAALAAFASVLLLAISPQLQFLLGGAFVNIGFRLQDHLHAYDLEHERPGTPGEIWKALLEHNKLAATVRKLFPRSTEHPVVALLACMDARIDTVELVGDTRRYYYVVRTAGALLSPAEQEMGCPLKNGSRPANGPLAPWLRHQGAHVFQWASAPRLADH